MSTYPTVLAGQDITADLMNSMLPQYKYKTAGTIRTNNTLTDDPDLTIQLAANAVYVIEFHIAYCANTTNIRALWTIPSGATGTRMVQALGSTQTGNDNTSVQSRVISLTSAANYGDASSVAAVNCYAFEQAVLTTTNAGTCAFQWAQTATTAENTQVGAGSYMKVTRIA